MGARVIAIVPMKPLAEAKGRLAGALSPEDRAALCLLMLCRVVLSARQARSVSDVWVVGGDGAVRVLSSTLGVPWHPDPGRDLNDSLALAFAGAFAAGAEAVLFLPSDLPLLTASDVEALAMASGGFRRVALTPALSDGGTNAILAPRGRPFPFRMGRDSFRLHLEALAERGMPVAAHRGAHLAFDLDTPAQWHLLGTLRPDLTSSLAEWRDLHRRLLALAAQAPYRAERHEEASCASAS